NQSDHSVSIAFSDPKTVCALERHLPDTKDGSARPGVQVEKARPVVGGEHHVVREKHADRLAPPASQDRISNAQGLGLNHDLDRNWMVRPIQELLELAFSR